MVTEKPRDYSSLPSEAEMIPLPNEDVTPPVTKMYFGFPIVFLPTGHKGIAFYTFIASNI